MNILIVSCKVGAGGGTGGGIGGGTGGGGNRGGNGGGTGGDGVRAGGALIGLGGKNVPDPAELGSGTFSAMGL